MEQIRTLTSLSHDELIARIEQYMVVVELRDAEIRELHAVIERREAVIKVLEHDCAELQRKYDSLLEIQQHSAQLNEAANAEIGRLREALVDMVYCHGHEDDDLFATWVRADSCNADLDNRRTASLNRARAALTPQETA